MTAVVTGAYEVPYGSPGSRCSTGGLLAGAVLGAVRAADRPDRVDGLAEQLHPPAGPPSTWPGGWG
ncbi:hypothetical protein HBB16_15865 [Pseudonocardia sp. MCCB 268]|nr:hypothetical protein [Pseudonocardia cytotoxica]